MLRLPTITEIMAALAKVRVDPETLTSGELQWLFAVVRSSYDDELIGQYEDLAHLYMAATEEADDLQQDTVIALSYLPCGLATEVVPDFIAFLASDPQFYELAHALVAIAFPRTSHTVDVISAVQRDVLAVIIENKNIWDLDMTFGDWLRQRGLPDDRTEAQRLLANSASK